MIVARNERGFDVWLKGCQKSGRGKRSGDEDGNMTRKKRARCQEERSPRSGKEIGR